MTKRPCQDRSNWQLRCARRWKGAQVGQWRVSTEGGGIATQDTTGQDRARQDRTGLASLDYAIELGRLEKRQDGKDDQRGRIDGKRGDGLR